MVIKPVTTTLSWADYYQRLEVEEQTDGTILVQVVYEEEDGNENETFITIPKSEFKSLVNQLQKLYG